MMRTTATTLTLFLTLTFTAACSDDRKTAATGAQPTAAAKSAALTPEQLGELGAQIRKNPDRADQLLSHHGLNHESFEKAIRDVTENPDASRRYAEAYKKAGA